MKLSLKGTSSKQKRTPSASLAPRRRSVETREDRGPEQAFRRNSTLTGSKSSRVVSAGPSAGTQLKSTRVQAHELAQQRRNIGVILLGVALSAIILCVLLSQFTASVVIRSSDNVELDEPLYAQKIDDYLRTQPAERLRFMLNHDRLNAYLRSVSPEVSSVQAKGGAGFGSSTFALTMRRPVASWSMNGSDQYVDTTGVAFTRSYFSTPSVQIIDESGIQVAAGQAVASDQFLGFVGKIVGAMGKQGYAVTQVIIPLDTTRQIELRLDRVGYPIKVSVSRSAGEQAEDIARTIRHFKPGTQQPKLLDVRVSGRAFYRD